MKLLRAEFENFRLLRHLELHFSANPDRSLTVIRAANESGKTTVYYGLQWALYGDSALPGQGASFRLQPIDWREGDGKRIPITATVDFEVSSYRQVKGTVRETRRKYRLVRTAFEAAGAEVRRPRSTISLFLLNEAGARPIEAPDSIIREMLPPELREVFFTDGDRALRFIEADVTRSTKRQRVEAAIRSLLGLAVIEKAIKHVEKAAGSANRKAKKIGGGGALNDIAARLESIDSDQEKLIARLDDAKRQFGVFDGKLSDIDREIRTALQKGDKEKLSDDLESTKRELKELHRQLELANKEHSTLFRGRSIAVALITPVLSDAFEKLEELRGMGKIPNTTIPVLEDRLAAECCICGATLKAGDPEGDRGRKHIRELIDESQRADEIQKLITNLYYSAKPLQISDHDGVGAWVRDYNAVVERREGLRELRERAGRQRRALEMQIDELDDTDIQGLRQTRREYRDQRDRFLSSRITAETQLEALKAEQAKLTMDRNRLLRAQKKGARVLAELTVTQDVGRVLRDAYERITNEELHKVSELMNRIFLEMIGADPDQGAIIRRAEISQEFDILVYGPNDRKLDPDRDLNGASRRALTLAFILALAKISEVEAPNVIDTPLGMTSGFVKRAILQTAVRESTQLTLFLTPDEIAGCEGIIDETAGTVCTLTNAVHYPTMLRNDPGVTECRIIQCGCDHRTVCEVCERLESSQK